jgi:hypothetical protein
VRWGKRVVGALLLLYAALVVYPQPLFACELRYGNVVLHSHRDLAPRALEILEDVRVRLARCEWDQGGGSHHVFLCDGWPGFRFFNPFSRGEPKGVANPVTRNLFIANPDLEAGRAYGADAKGGTSRGLAGAIAHEVTHDLIRSRFGLFGARALPNWKVEGYCEYVAGEGTFDVARGVALLKAGTFDRSPAFRYLHWRLLATYALEVERIGAERFFADELALPGLDARMVAALRDGSFRPAP